MDQKTKTFKDLLIWQKAFEIFKMVCEDVRKWPKDVISRGISYQLMNSAGSMSANIAEGYGRGGPKEFEQFLRFNRGSQAESDDWLTKAEALGLISDKRYLEYSQKFEELTRMTSSFINRLRTQTKR